MKCNQCGKETPSNLPNCVHCGNSFKHPSAGATKPAAAKQQAHDATLKSVPKNPYANPYKKPGASANPYAKPAAKPQAGQNPYAKPDFPVQQPVPTVSMAPLPATAGAGQSSGNSKLGLILGLSIGGGVVLIGIIIALIFAFSYKRPTGLNPTPDGVCESYVYLDDVVSGFEEVEKPYLKDGYADHAKADELIQAAYEYADSLVKSGKATEANLEEETLSVYCKLKEGDEFVYSPRFENIDSGGSESRIATYQPFYSLGKALPEPDESAKEISKKMGFAFKDNYDDEEVDLDGFDKMKGAKVILWHGHGEYTKKTGYIIKTGLKYKTLKSSIRYKKWCNNNNIVAIEGGYSGFKAGFFDDYFKKGDLNGAVIYLATCYSGYTNEFTDVLLAKGAKTIYANSDTIYTDYNISMMKSVCFALAKGQTAFDALRTAQKKHGDLSPEPVVEKGKKHYAQVIVFGDDNLKLVAEKNETTTASNVDYNNIEKYIKTYASDYAGGFMPMRGDGSNVYFADKYYKPIGIYQFNAASGSTKKIVSLSEPAYGKANIVEFYEEGIGVKLYNTGEMQYDAVTVYDHSGASVAGNANEYVCEYDGERVYSANGESVESWRADGGKVYNSDFDFTVETSPFAGGNVMQVYTYHGKEFIELYYQNRYIIITRVGDTYKEIAEVESTCYLDGSSLYYIKSGNILKIDLSGGDYKATTFCKADASYIYYITGNHVCYGKTSKNGAHFTAYSMDVGSKAVDSDCPMDGI